MFIGSILLVSSHWPIVGIAAPSILSFLIIADTYPIHQQRYLMGILNGLINVATGISPVIGSYLTMYFYWQGNFTVLLIFGLMTLGMTLLFIPKYKPPEHKETISLQGYTLVFQSKPLMLLICTIIFICVPYWIFVGMAPLLYIKDLGVSLSQFGYYQGSLALIFGFGSILLGLVINNVSSTSLYVVL